MTPLEFWLAVAGAAVVTYAWRALFLVPERTRPPVKLEPALRLVGPAVLAALAVPAILRAPDTGGLDAGRVLAGVLAFAVAWRTRSVLWTIVAGFTVLVLVGMLTGA